MFLKRDGKTAVAFLIESEGKPAILLAGQAIIALDDPMLDRYAIELESPSELRKLREARRRQGRAEGLHSSLPSQARIRRHSRGDI